MGLSDLVKKATGAPTPEKTRSSSISYGRPSLEQDSVDKGAEGDDVSVLDEKEGNVILAMISQLRPGMDLSKIAFPTFVLEPRSMLERITDFFSHPDLIFGADKNEDPTERFLAVLRYYLSGWHIKPKGVKKPYNAVLGEIFRCSYRYPDGSEGFYVAEQVSHHPPVSAYFYISPANGVLIYGELRPKSKFLGNSAATIMDGENRVILMNKRQDGEYSIGMPNMYARGILFGKLILELGDTSAVRNPTTGLACDVEFKTKGFFSGTYNAVVGKVKKDGHTIGDLDGFWSDSVVYKDVKTGKKQTLFDAHSASVTPKIMAPESEQEPNESRRLWSGLTAAIRNQDMEGATEAKNAVEERQRERARKRGDENIPLRYFRQAGDKYVPLCGVIDLPKDPKECVEKIRSWIWPQGAGAPSAFNGPTSPSAARAVPVPTAAASQRGGTVAGSSMSSSSSGGSFQSAASSHPIGYSPVSPQRQAPASTASTEPIIPAGSGAPPEMTTSLAGSASRSTASSTTLPEGPTPEQVAASLAEAHITAPGPPKGAVSPQPPLRSAAD